MAKEAHDSVMARVDEIARIQKYLDPHDVIKVENETELDVRKAEQAEGLATS